MPSDQEQPATDPYPEGWGFGQSSIKAHYFRSGALTSICGKATSANSRRRKRVPYGSDCAVCQARYADATRIDADDALRVVKLIETSTDKIWRYEVRQAGRAFACEISASTALDRPEAIWWGERGNAKMALAEAERWAERQALRMAAAAFADADFTEARKP